MSKQTASAAAADATAAFIASGRAVAKLPPGKARAPATEPNDDAIAAAATAAAATAVHIEAPAATPAPATADHLDEYGPIVAPAATPAPAADWRDEYGPVVAPAATPAPAASGVKGWAKAGATYHADDAVIDYVAPCPKKPGSQTYSRYNAAYAVGRTIAQAKALGATAGDILWDLKRGFITVRAPNA